MNKMDQIFTRRINEPAERCEAPLPQLTDQVAELETKVSTHLERMGFAW